MTRLKLLFAAVALSVALPALAYSSASVSLGPIKIELVDLNPTDGITPSIDYSISSGSFAEVSQTSPLGAVSDSDYSGYSAGTSRPTAANAKFGSAEASAGTIAAVAPAHGAMLASGKADDFISSTAEEASFAANAHASMGFELSRNTMAIFRVEVLYTAAGRAGFGDSVFSSVGGSMTASSCRHDFGCQRSEREFTHNNRAYSRRPGQPGSFDEVGSFTMAVWYVNLDDGVPYCCSGDLDVFVGASGTTYMNQVVLPEPASFALLLSGLALVGVAARRRASVTGASSS
jgi:hypothetical protein